MNDEQHTPATENWTGDFVRDAPSTVNAIRQRTAVLLDAKTPREKLTSVCAEIFEALLSLSPAARDAAGSERASTRIESGVALSPSLAAQCLLDGARTAAFLRGARAAIHAARTHSNGAEVVYAGTGPFAPLALLLAPFIPPPTRLTLIDVHEEAVRSVASLVSALSADALVAGVVRADATVYRHPRPIDILISETMQRSLADEPFVAIVRNFRDQLAPAGVIVPERVTLSAITVSAQNEQRRWAGATVENEVEEIGKLFEVTAAGDWPENGDARIATLCGSSSDQRWLAIATDIVVHGAEKLGRYDSGLTTPEIVWELSPVRGRRTLRFRYVMRPRPYLAVAPVETDWDGSGA